MKKLATKICSLALALALALCCLPSAFAAENEITVSFSFYDGAVVIPKTDDLKVYDGIAEEYGYTLSSNGGITVFDAIVAAHKGYYGEAFTAETAGDYLAMSYGFMTKAFGLATSNLGFCVNDEVPNDGIFNEAYNSYTGYACDTAAITNGDYVSFYTYQSSYWADYYVTLSANEIDATAGKEFTVAATGYSVMWYGCYKEEDRAAYTYPMAGLDVYTTTDFNTYTKVGTLDEKGEITLTINEIGTTYICVMGSFEDPMMGSCPAIANWCEVTVSEPEGAIYIPNSIEVEADTETADGVAALHFTIGYFDITGEGPDKTECFTIEITFAPLVCLIKFLASAF